MDADNHMTYVKKGRRRKGHLTEKKEVAAYCKGFPGAYEDYPFHDPNWCVIRHKDTKKIFAMIYERKGEIWLNVKCSPEWRDFWRDAFPSVIPAYHMNKAHWNTIILDGSVPDPEIKRMIAESYDLTAGKRKK